MDPKRKAEIEELVKFAPTFRVPPAKKPLFASEIKKPLSDSEIKKRLDKINLYIEAARFLQNRDHKITNTDDDSYNAVEAKADEKESVVDEKLSKATIKTSRHEIDEEDKEPPTKRPCVE